MHTGFADEKGVPEGVEEGSMDEDQSGTLSPAERGRRAITVLAGERSAEPARCLAGRCASLAQPAVSPYSLR